MPRVWSYRRAGTLTQLDRTLNSLVGAHHFTVKPNLSAIWTHGEVLALLLSLYRTSSLPDWNLIAVERLHNS